MANKEHQRFVKTVKKLAKELDTEPTLVTKAQLLQQGDIAEWELRKNGGFAALRNMYFPQPTDGLDVKYGGRAIRSHQTKLEKQYGQQEFFYKAFLGGVTDLLKAQPLKFHKPATKRKPTKASDRTIVMKVSDTHFGANISAAELNYSNEYNWTIASRRLAMLCEQVSHYKEDRRATTDLVIQLNGDIIAGQIHNQEWFVDLLTDQFAGSLSILGQAITYLANQFKSVHVVCTPGNHGRNVGKADHGRATTHKWDSYEGMIYIALRELITRTTPNVRFTIPEAPFALYQVMGHWILQTHGDTVINVGNPGKAISMASINAQVNKFNASSMLANNQHIGVLCVGHVHVPTAQLLEGGCMAVINGCMSGTDPFAQSIGIFSNNPTQVIFETTKAYAVGDLRMVQLKAADDDKALDKIVQPYVRTTK